MSTSFGVTLSQIISLSLIPLLTRLYTPEEFTLWVLYNVIVIFLGGLSTFRYADAIVYTKSERVRRRLLPLCILSGGVISLFSIFIALYLVYIGKGIIVMMLPFSIMSYCLFYTSSQYMVSLGRFSLYSVLIIFLNASPVLNQCLFKLWFEGRGLILGGIFSHLSLGAVSLFLLIRFKSFSYCWDFSVIRLAKLFKRYPLYSGGFFLSSMIRSKGIYFFLEKTGGIALSKYSQADKLLNAPSSFLGAIIRPVFFQYMSNHSIFDYSEKLCSMTFLLWRVLFPLSIPFFIVSEDLFASILGEQWRDVGYYAKILIIPSILNMSTNWLDRCFDLLRMQRINFLIELFFAILTLIVLVVFYKFQFEMKSMVMALSLILTIFYIVWTFTIFKNLKLDSIFLLREVMVPFCATLALYLITVTFNLSTTYSLVLAILAIAMIFPWKKVTKIF